MLRTRLLWFTLGFSITGASVAHLVWRDLYAERFAISSDMKEKFNALEGRVSGLESTGNENLSPAQDETESSKEHITIVIFSHNVSFFFLFISSSLFCLPLGRELRLLEASKPKSIKDLASSMRELRSSLGTL